MEDYDDTIYMYLVKCYILTKSIGQNLRGKQSLDANFNKWYLKIINLYRNHIYHWRNNTYIFPESFFIFWHLVCLVHLLLYMELILIEIKFLLIKVFLKFKLMTFYQTLTLKLSLLITEPTTYSFLLGSLHLTYVTIN